MFAIVNHDRLATLHAMPDLTGLDLVGSERDVLLYYLNKNREAVVRTLDGLRCRPAPPATR